MGRSKSKARKELTLTESVQLFILAQEVEGKSPLTINWYQLRLGRFIQFTGDILVSDLSLEHGQRFLLHLSKANKYAGHPKQKERQEPISRATLRNYARAIRGFASYLNAEDITKENVFQRLKMPKDDKRVIEILRDDEIKLLYDQINPSTKIGSRLFLIVTALLDTGIRVGELAGIAMDDIDFRHSRVKVKGKGSKERVVPFGVTTAKAMLNYINHHRAVSWSDRLLLNLDGEPMTIQAMMQSIKRLGVKAGVPRIHAHLFRHTFAVKWLRNGGDLFVLQAVLGHEDLSVTRLYVHLAQQDLEIQHRAVSPVDKLGIARKLRK